MNFFAWLHGIDEDIWNLSSLSQDEYRQIVESQIRQRKEEERKKESEWMRGNGKIPTPEEMKEAAEWLKRNGYPDAPAPSYVSPKETAAPNQHKHGKIYDSESDAVIDIRKPAGLTLFLIIVASLVYFTYWIFAREAKLKAEYRTQMAESRRYNDSVNSISYTKIKTKHHKKHKASAAIATKKAPVEKSLTELPGGELKDSTTAEN